MWWWEKQQLVHAQLQGAQHSLERHPDAQDVAIIACYEFQIELWVNNDGSRQSMAMRSDGYPWMKEVEW
jgi:hypothetical protein